MTVRKQSTLKHHLTFTELAKMKNRDYYNCVFPEKRPRSVWVVYDTQGDKIGEVAAMTEIEARQKVAQHVMIPFRLSHIEE